MSFASASVQYLLSLLSISTQPSCFSFSFVNLNVRCLSWCFACCIECHIVLEHQPLLHPNSSFVGLSRCAFSNVVSFRVCSRSKRSVEASRDDSAVGRCFCTSSRCACPPLSTHSSLHQRTLCTSLPYRLTDGADAIHCPHQLKTGPVSSRHTYRTAQTPLSPVQSCLSKARHRGCKR